MRERSPNEKNEHFSETINALGSILMRTSSTQESAWCVAKHAIGELGYINCIIYLFNDDRKLFQCATHGNKNHDTQDVLNPIPLKRGEGLIENVARTGKSKIIADTSKDTRYTVDNDDGRSEITVPILSDGLVIGIIDCVHPETEYFSDHDLNILNTIASMLSFKISQAKAIEELAIINKELAFQNEEKQKRADELAFANKELAFQNKEKEKRASELAIANTELAFQNEEKQKRADELAIANEEYAFQNEEKEKRADELAIANKELAFQNEEKQKRADELAIANTELAFQNKEKQKRADELAIANEELTFQNEEKEKRAHELTIANTELAFQNEEKQKRADELAIANTELAFQNEEKQKRADELTIANTELAFQNEEKQKRADELAIANKELAFQNKEKQKRADELAIANTEYAFQNEEKEKRADELAIANEELAFQNEEKQKRADELAVANKELAFQNEEKQKRADELNLANREKEKQANALTIAVKELAFQNELEKTRIETESIAKELRQFIETANAPIFGIDNEGLVNEWNQTSEKITGFKKEDVLGQNLVENYITKTYQVAVKKVLYNALNGEETTNYEFPLFTKSGKRIMVLLNSSTRRNVDGKIIGVIGVGQDISEMDTLRTASEAIAKELRQFIETANAPIFGIDSKGLVNEWNQTSEKITGFTKDEVLGKNLVKTYITEDYRDAVKKVLDNALKGKETANFEFPLFAKNGQRVMVLLNSSSRRDAGGEIVGMLGVGQDITILNEYKKNLESKVEFRTQELQESLEREKELGQLKTSFVSMASHEFRTPLTSIKATSDIILRYFDRLSREDINERLEKIKREVEDMTIMLEDILIIGKSDAQKLDYNPELLDIVSLIKDIITEYHLSESENRPISYIISSPVIMVNADKKWIKHIVINLFSNATKYSDKNKPIEITIKQKQSSVSFCFKDYGIGISKEDIKLVFESFHRGENVQNISGTGLGLSVLQRAVDLHKGKVEIKSKIGEGSNFKIILPFNKK
jgi:PAS domain S-box-containing protein